MNKRLDILEREEDIRQWIKEEKTLIFMCKELSCKYGTLKRVFQQLNIEYHGMPNRHKNKRNGVHHKYPIEEFLNNKRPIQSSKLKKRLIKEKIKEARCEECGLTEWQGVPIPLELHHKDGNHFNNSIDNLRILCPNCHSLTDTFRGRNKKISKKKKRKPTNKYKKMRPIYKVKYKRKYCPVCGKRINHRSKTCAECYQIKSRTCERPNREKLKKEIRIYPITKIGAMYGVSDNAIRKWCKCYQLPYSSRKIKNYSDEEWNDI